MNDHVDPDSAGLLQQYLTALRDRGAEMHRIDGLGSDDQPLFRIKGLGYLLVSMTQEFPGLWQIDQTLVDEVQQRADEEGVNAWFPLLIARRDGRGANGYILADFSSTPVKRDIEAVDGRLVIREKRHLDSLRLILSTEKQAELLMRKRT